MNLGTMTSLQSPISNLQSPITKIAVFRALYLGDLLCAVPAFRALRKLFPQAEISLIGLPWAAELVERLPYLDNLLPFRGYPGLAEVAYDERRSSAFLAEAQATGYDLAIQMHGDGSVSNGFVAALGTRHSLGYRRDPNDSRLSLALPYCDDDHETMRWLRLVGMIGASCDETRLVFPHGRGDSSRAAALLRELPPGYGPVVGLHVGAKDAARRWPTESFARLGDALAEQLNARIVLTGSPAERPLTEAVRNAMRSPALDLAGASDLGTFAALIARLDLLVTNDTGASHMAAAKGTRSVILFGPSRPQQWAPLDGERHHALDALAHGDGLADLPVRVVLEACAKQMNREVVRET
ncbi:MAG: glycosyltransferase family 9 protein [Chloroflexaceae bacterium]|jgi:ADP-heptose:LPS heptosyltransferase|nr:glycosyltransferase family 9 protein [Chloroflexaceae bacterium]